MKKFILSAIVLSSLTLASFAVNKMNVKKNDGTIVSFDVDSVDQVYFVDKDTIEFSGEIPGTLPGLFSVSAEKQVHFSMGNLQYRVSTETWRFAEHQQDTIGIGNDNISTTYDGWLDLFGWGTSGYDNTDNDRYAWKFYPFSNVTSMVDAQTNWYGYGPSTSQEDADLVGTSANYDWGVYNAISNGGNRKGLWRVLSKAEWDYVYSERANADSLHAYATLEGIPGLVLFPDDWTTPESVFVLMHSLVKDNTFDAAQWTILEENGAVFLPFAGCRHIAKTSDCGEYGYYWSSTHHWPEAAYYFNASNSYSKTYSDARYIGYSVRLVHE